MNLTKQELIDLPVYTRSNQHLGKVVDFGLDSSTHMISQYYVRSTDLIRGLLTKELIISQSQVVSLTNKKMIVEDSVSRQQEEAARKVALAG